MDVLLQEQRGAGVAYLVQVGAFGQTSFRAHVCPSFPEHVLGAYGGSLVCAEYPLTQDRLPFLVPLQRCQGRAAEFDVAPAVGCLWQTDLALAQRGAPIPPDQRRSQL